MLKLRTDVAAQSNQAGVVGNTAVENKAAEKVGLEKAALRQPEAPSGGIPKNVLELSPIELAAVLERGSASARQSAASTIALIARAEQPTLRVAYAEGLVDKSATIKKGADRDANLTKSSPSVLFGVSDTTARAMFEELGIKSVGEFAAATPAKLMSLASSKDPANVLSDTQLKHLITLHGKLQRYDDTKPVLDLQRIGKVRTQLATAQETVERMASVLDKNPVALTNSLVRLGATFQWLEDAQSRLAKLSDEAIMARSSGGTRALRDELSSIRDSIDGILAKKDSFFDAKTAVDDGKTPWNPALHDTKTALLTHPLDANPYDVHPLPNLNPTERIIETEFITAFKSHHRRMVREFLKMVRKDGGNVIEPDNAKLLSPRYSRPDLVKQIHSLEEQIKQLRVMADEGSTTAADRIGQLELKIEHAKREIGKSRAESNIPLHMTATVIARLALVQALDDLAADKSIPADKKTLLITCGGCAAGKGTSLTKAGETVPQVKTASLVYDTDGETSGVFNKFAMEEALKRGIKPIFLYVHADPKDAWGRVYSRAAQVGRMVSEEPFLDSHVDSPRNFQEFHAAHKHDKDVTFLIIDNSKGGKPELVSELPSYCLTYDRDELRNVIRQQTDTAQVDPHAQKIARRSRKIWHDRTGGQDG
ncbi:MAG: hypothetical protein U1E65_10395 [Myxococcota bacterium]